MIEMKFNNQDAIPKRTIIKTRRADAKVIARWYAAFYAGDRYNVLINGKPVLVNRNGEIEI